MDTGRFGRSVHPRRLTDQVLVHPGDLLDLFQWIIFHHPFFERIPAMDIIFHETLLIKVFLDDDAVKTQSHGRICSRTDLKPEVRFVRQKPLSGIDADQLRSPFVSPPEILSLIFIRVGPLRVAGPDDYAFGPSLIIRYGQGATGNQG